jgi:hypothetical protein
MMSIANTEVRFHIAEIFRAEIFSVADCQLQVVADCNQAADIWREAGKKYNMTQLAADQKIAASGMVEIFCHANPPTIPSDWEMDCIEHGASYSDGHEIWLAVADSLIIIEHLSAPRLQIWVGKTEFARSVEGLDILLAYALPSILRCCHRFEIHAAGLISPNSDRGILVLGDSGSGKSTLAVRLVQSGWQYLSDDLMLLQAAESEVKAWGLRRVFALTDQTIQFCFATRIASELRGEKYYILPEDLWANAGATLTKPAALFFTRLTFDATSSVERLAPAEAMLQLIRQSPWLCYDPRTSQTHTNILKQLTGQAPAYQLNAGRDLLLEPEAAHRLLQPYL